MRFAIPALALLGGRAITQKDTADPAPTTQPERTATPPALVTDSASTTPSAATAVPAPPHSSSTAASQPAGPSPAAPALSAQEQRLLNQGYKPQMRDGEKIYCRREKQLGSRISTVQHCGTVAQLTTTTQDGKDYLEKTQRSQLNPMGH